MFGARSTAIRASVVAAALVLGGSASAQEMEVKGRVADTRGNPVAGADVTFLPLPAGARPRPGTKARYRIAQAAHRAAVRLPRTRTARDGTFRCLVSPSLAGLAAGSGVEMAMQVSAAGYRTWMRAIGDRLEGADGQIAVLPDATATGAPLLDVRVATGVDGPYRGYALIERAYRARPDRSIWLRELLPLDPLGRVVYHEPARVPGEVDAMLPTARPEGYRVTLWVAGLDPWQRTLAEGVHEVRPERSDFPARRVLAERGEPARLPIEATYEVAGEEVTLRLDEARVPLLGGEAPVRVQSGSGPVVVDAWDPDLALFVDGSARAPVATTVTHAEPATTRQAQLVVLDRARQPLFGAAIWLEDAAAQSVLPEHAPWAVTDPQGNARLAGLPRGAHWALVRHPTAGEREVLLDTVQPGPVEVQLRDRAASEGRSAFTTAPGSILLDFEHRAGPEEALEVGVVQVGQRMLRRGFDERPRLVRIEGLIPGPVTVWARLAEGPLHVSSSVLATAEPQPPVRPLHAPARTYTFDVRTHDGQTAAGAYVSLGEAAPRGREPFTARLLPVVRDEASGRFALTLHLLGDLWVVVHGTDGARRDVLLRGEGGPPTVEVRLPAAPPPPEKEGADKDGPREAEGPPEAGRRG